MFPASRKLERYGPFAAGLAVAVLTGLAVALLLWAVGEPVGSRPVSVAHYVGLASVFGCGVLSILSSRLNRRTVAAMEGTRVMRFAEETGYRRDVDDYLAQERKTGVCLILYSVIVAGWASTAGTVFLVMEAGIFGMLVWMGLTGYRNIALMQRLVDRLTEEARG